MALCKFCGTSAGFFKDRHPECAQGAEKEAEKAAEKERALVRKVAEVKALMASAPEGAISVDELVKLITPITEGNSEITWRAFCVWITAMASADRIPTTKEERLAVELAKHYDFSKERVPDSGWDKLVRLCIMRDLSEGKIPERIRIDGGLPFNMEAGERIVWLFNDAEYLEDRVVRSSNRSYGGLSVRVAPGIYLHGGQSAPAATSEGFVSIDHGTLALTDRAVLFQGTHRALRFKYKDIASFTRYDYGFAICKGTQTARPVGFQVKDVFAGFPDSLLRGLCEVYMQSAGGARRTKLTRPDEVTE